MRSARALLALAESEGFEPPVPLGTPDFESGTFNHSDSSPLLSGAALQHWTDTAPPRRRRRRESNGGLEKKARRLPGPTLTGILAATRGSPNMPDTAARPATIRLRGVRQNNLRDIDLDLPGGQLIAITGVSGSGKSSLAFDTLHAEGQRRYVECLSSYARQFLGRMDRPQADSIEGIQPTIALEQGRRIRSSRSTVATLTEIADYMKVVFAAAAAPDCPGCGASIHRLRAPQVVQAAQVGAVDRRAIVTFPLRLRGAALIETARLGLAAAGYHRSLHQGQTRRLDELAPADWLGAELHIIQDRLRIEADDGGRLFDSVDQALRRGAGVVDLWLEGAPLAEGGALRPTGSGGGGLRRHRASVALHCDACDLELSEPVPNLFSFNSPVGACPGCNGFGRVMEIDWSRCIPNPALPLRGAGGRLAKAAIRPWSTKKTSWERRQLFALCDAVGIDTDVPWRDLPQAHRDMIIEGHSGPGVPRYWGLRQWFGWLETRAYKMHVRVRLARYRAYVTCPACAGARLRPEALAWKLGPEGAAWTLPDWMVLPLQQWQQGLQALDLDGREREALDLPLRELDQRVGLLCELGLGYLSAGRSGRTLSGGELQRVQLVTALASGLSQVLYILDEPSIGLHPRDNARLMTVLHRLRAAGNTVAMVEHDPALIRAADMVVDLGPGAGEQGGHVVWAGPPDQMASATGSLTADYLSGRRQVVTEAPRPLGPARDAAWLRIVGATARNLQGDPVALRRGALNVICGVSGSGKSTLVEEVLMRGLRRRLGQITKAPGAHEAIEGAEDLDTVLLVGPEPIAGSNRANPATWLKAWDAIRRRLAAEPLARERGYSAGTFSFNRAGGRCDVCDGAGLEVVDMQFLSDVRITCQACAGQRFKREVLEVRHRGRSVADLLAMTAQEVVDEFAHDRALARPMRAMCELGLGYLRLGQPLGTLSGGESQRLKIAHHLLCARTRGALLILDEPSTGLHLDDVRVLINSLRRLVTAGNTVVVVEHHLDVIAAADHLVELGPEGGPGGGRVVFEGRPETLLASAHTATGAHLAAQQQQTVAATPLTEVTQLDPGHVRVRGARVNNLRNLDLAIPRDTLTVITGLSGSGKSSLAFDVIFAEGQRRFLDCLSPYARQYLPPVGRPDVDALDGLPPTVAIAQRTTRGGARSTVATLTDIYPYLRLLFARCGVQHCPRCGDPVTGQGADDVATAVQKRCRGSDLFVMVPAIRGRKGWHRDVIERHRIAGRQWTRVDGQLHAIDRVPELARYSAHDIDEVVACLPWNAANTRPVRGGRRWQVPVLAAAIEAAIAAGEGTILVQPQDGPLQIHALHRHCGRCDLGVEPPDPLLFAFNSARGRCAHCRGSGVEPAPDKGRKRKRRRRKKVRDKELEQAKLERDNRAGEQEPQRVVQVCSQCEGSRLRPEARSVRVGGQTIDALVTRTPGALRTFLKELPWQPREAAVAADIVVEVGARCDFLEEIGLDYLQLGRAAITLSGGESQRIRLAAQLGSNLRGVLYVLDEPTIGLHPADNERLLAAFEALMARGNGLLVVEHDEATIRRARHIIELGPGGGSEGGQVLLQGSLADLMATPASPTGQMLASPAARRSRDQPRAMSEHAGWVTLRGARRNNLRGLDVRLARGRFNAVSGVSGSGKSTLIRDLLVEVGADLLANPEAAADALPGIDAVEGLAGLGRIVEVDQSPIGRTPRSCPATYIGVFNPIRRCFAALPEAKVLGLTTSRFSFNVAGGRCETCTGAGVERIEMSFLPTGYKRCEACEGARYNPQTLRVNYLGATIADVLEMSIAEAAEHFRNVPAIHRPLALAARTGLGYLRLGQGSNTVSGGEAQRIKIVSELRKRHRHETLYVLDEPSTGLHLADQKRLLDVLHQLVDRGDTLVVIEHNLDVLREADWLVDLGPGGGEGGGQLCWQGPVADLIDGPLQTPTALALRGVERTPPAR